MPGGAAVACRPNDGNMPVSPRLAYEQGAAEIEQRALDGALTIAQVRQEMVQLRERLGVSTADIQRWAAGA